MAPKHITILDANTSVYQDHKQYFDQYSDLTVIGGATYMDDLASYECIIKTPGISLYHPKLLAYKDRITTQAQLFFDYYPGKIIAVSGTKGKSTTATLIYKTLQEAGKKVQLIGNIGNPVLEYLPENFLDEEEYVVFEVSSYMLENLHKKNYISVLVNIYPDHLDWHQGFQNYLQAKL